MSCSCVLQLVRAQVLPFATLAQFFHHPIHSLAAIWVEPGALERTALAPTFPEQVGADGMHPSGPCPVT
eukprot:15056094-Alexandrium_andersonii.AAC.1